MRKKLQEIRNKEEGFTLVELLAVIVILGIILAIAIPAVGNVISKAENDANEAEMGLIVDAGRLYITAEKEESVKVRTLLENGYLEERDSTKFSDKKEWTVKKEKGDDKKVKYVLYNEMEQKYPKPKSNTGS